jgi:hypothetical protein
MDEASLIDSLINASVADNTGRVEVVPQTQMQPQPPVSFSRSALSLPKIQPTLQLAEFLNKTASLLSSLPDGRALDSMLSVVQETVRNWDLSEAVILSPEEKYARGEELSREELTDLVKKLKAQLESPKELLKPEAPQPPILPEEPKVSEEVSREQHLQPLSEDYSGSTDELKAIANKIAAANGSDPESLYVLLSETLNKNSASSKQTDSAKTIVKGSYAAELSADD